MSSEQQETKLRLCPFCGSSDLSENQWAIVECNECYGAAPKDVWNGKRLLSDLLSMVSINVSKDTIQEWTEEQQDQAVEWAGAVHLHASDNDDVEVPEKPDFLPEGKVSDGGLWT